MTASASVLHPQEGEVAGSVRVRRLRGWTHAVATTLGFFLAAYSLYWVVGIVPPHVYRPTFLLVALVLTFFVYPASSSARPGGTAGVEHRPSLADWALMALSSAALLWPVVDLGQFEFRAATPTDRDLVLGAVLVVVVLEGTRRTVGWILPLTAGLFLVYAHFGPVLDRVGLSLIAHRGYAPDRIIGTLYMTLEGILGVPLDVAATYIVLFTLYGAIIEHSGAGRFFVDWAMSAIGRSSRSGPGRTVTLAGYLLGAVSGSGVANTVMLGAVSWPMMRRAGYPADTAGAILAAAGIGAILAPPVMGAAAFIIAEFLNISYLEVAKMALLPAALYYLSIVVTVEANSRALALRHPRAPGQSLAAVTREGWYHFASFAAIAVLLAQGVTAFRAVFWATAVAVGVSFFNREHALRPKRLITALSAGSFSVLPIVATTATAGIIVGIVTLTGLGLKAASLIIAMAGGNLFLTVVFAGLAVWVLGLAVPVTACYIIAAVMVAPALTQVGVPATAAHMFIFYYAVLSEVSPPTALSPFAAAAVTGGSPFRTTMLAWKYTLPAFIVPFTFTMSSRGAAVLLQGSISDILLVSLIAVIGVAVIAVSTAGFIRQPATALERILGLTGGILLLTADLRAAAAGVALAAAMLFLHFRRT